MSVYLLVLALSGRCATADLCPSDEDLLAAIRARDTAIAADPESRRVAREQNYTLPLEPAEAIEDVHCRPEASAGPYVVVCSYTVRYPDETSYEALHFEWDGHRWTMPHAVEDFRSSVVMRVGGA